MDSFTQFEHEGWQRVATNTIRSGPAPLASSFRLCSKRLEWKVPSARFVFEAELKAGVRMAGLLARQTPAALGAIQSALEEAMQPYAQGDGYMIPKAAYIVAARKPCPARRRRLLLCNCSFGRYRRPT